MSMDATGTDAQVEADWKARALAAEARVEEAEGERDRALAGERLASRVVARHLPDAVESAERDAALLAAEERVRQLSEVVEAASEIATRIEQDFLYCPICEHVHNALDGSHEPLCPFAALARLQVDSEGSES